MSIYYVPGIVSNPRDTAVTTQIKIPATTQLAFPDWVQKVKQKKDGNMKYAVCGMVAVRRKMKWGRG